MTFMYYGIKVKTRVLYPFDVFGKFYFVWREWSGFFVVVIFDLFLSLFHNLYYFRGWRLELLGRMVILQCIVWGRSA